jgi:hypothetical protein
MLINRQGQLFSLLLAAAIIAAPALAQQPPTTDQAPAPPAAPATPPPVKKKPKPKPAAATQPPATTEPAPVPAAEPGAPVPAKKPPKPKPATAAPLTPAAPGALPAAVAGGAKPTLLGQYGEWGAYAATPGGKKICFAIAKPALSETTPPNRPRNPSYMFISSRPGEKVSNEVSIIIGYPFKSSAEATVEVGTTSFSLYTQQDGAWIKNATEEARLIEAMRAGQNAVVKGTSVKGTRTTDTFSLKGLAQALDRTDRDCK